MKKIGFRTSAKFTLQLPKSNGFTLETALAELIDNTIDAQAGKVTIKKVKQENTPHDGNGEYFTYTITDDGGGMSYEELENIIPTLGYEGHYENDSVGHFGIGGRFAMLFLCDRGTITLHSVKDKKKTKLIITPQENIPQDEFITLYNSEDTNDKNGVEITITNVLDTNNNSTKEKFLGVTYYPQNSLKKDFEIEFIDQNEDNTRIEFCDPMYRNKSEKYVRKITFDEDDENYSCWVNGHYVETVGYLFNSDEFTDKDYNKYDTRKDKGFVLSRAGLYIRLGGRYISLGSAYFPGYSPQYYLSRLRIEVNVPKECIETFGIQLNKSKVEINYESPHLRNWYKCIKYIVQQAQSEQKPAKITQKEEQDLADHNRILNDLIKNRGKLKNPLDNENLKKLIPKELNFPKVEPSSTKNRPTGLIYEKHDKNIVEIRYVEGRDTEPRYTGSRHLSKTIISINTGHPHYQKCLRKLDLSGQRAILLEYYFDYIKTTVTQLDFDYLDENLFYEITKQKDEGFRRIYAS